MVEQAHALFFERNGLHENNWIDCHTYARTRYPDHDTYLPIKQGYCSYTLILSPYPHSHTPQTKVLQFRPEQYPLNAELTHAAKALYGPLAPETSRLSDLHIPNRNDNPTKLLVYELERICGTPLSLLLPAPPPAPPFAPTQHARLTTTFAHFIAASWPAPDTPLSSTHALQTGPVGSRIASKVARLATSLPTPALRLRARHISSALRTLDCLPSVLTHGDLVPSNIMVDPSSGALLGCVDWAEAEYLPFGTCLYGLEYLLGSLASDSTFEYHAHAAQLRALFWDEMCVCVPGLRDAAVLRAVRLARDVGVLLWFGYAFDEGRIDRVVNERDDMKEVGLLRTFLGVEEEARACI